MPSRAFIDSDRQGARESPQDSPFVLMPSRAFIDSDIHAVLLWGSTPQES